MNSGYKKKNKGPDAVQQPPFTDKFRRCNRCFISKGVYGQPDVGSIMIVETVRIEVKGGPNIDIAKTVRCISCGYVYEVVVYRAGYELGITKISIFALLNAWRATPTFTLEELKSGRITPVELPDRIKEMMSRPNPNVPKFGQDYNPDEHIEPTIQTEFPL